MWMTLQQYPTTTSSFILGEESSTINDASAFVGSEHREHSSSSAMRAHKLRSISLWVLLFTLKRSGLYKTSDLCNSLK